MKKVLERVSEMTCAHKDPEDAFFNEQEGALPKWKWIFPTTWLKKILDHLFRDAKHVRSRRRASVRSMQKMERVLVGLPYSLSADNVVHTECMEISEDAQQQWIFPLREWAPMYANSQLYICYIGLDHKGRSEALLRGTGDTMDRHVHLGHDETIFVLEGTLEDMISGKTYDVGSRLSVPKYTEHAFRVNGLLLLKWYPPLNILTSSFI